MDLRHHILSRIQAEGPLSFKDFMAEALYHPQWGYYSQAFLPIGIRGDFVTSPHAHPLFGALLARQIEELDDLLENGPFTLVEMGAGMGHLARDILGYLSGRPFFDRLTYRIVEPRRASVEAQRATLADFAQKVRWHADLSEIAPFRGCLLSNELLDAFPVHVIEKGEGGFQEVRVGEGAEGFVEVLGEATDPGLIAYMADLPASLSVGYRTEVNLELRDWVGKAARVLEAGFVLTVDYGHTAEEYFHPARNRGTLLAYRGHAVDEDLLGDPGQKDLTAHVNFTDLHRWGEAAGLSTLGYSPQWAFLAGLDVEATLKEVLGGMPEPFSPQMAGVKALLLPQGMGESHKVMVQAKGIPAGVCLGGLRYRNLKDRLVQA